MCLKFLITCIWVLKAKNSTNKEKHRIRKRRDQIKLKGKGSHSSFFPIFICSATVIADMVPWTEKDAVVNYDFVSGCKFPIWHSTAHVPAFLGSM